MSQLGTVYATKRRRRNGKSLKAPPKEGMTKSNPSKRHRERLNAELDLLASLLPFEQNILSKLDRLSILRLSVSYLRTKSYFQVVMHKSKEENGIGNSVHPHDSYRTREIGSFETGPLDGEMFLQALNGFIIILTCEGEVFFATHTIESYLGFHQSDIVHQSVYELVHSEDREELQRQLLWNTFLPADLSGLQLTDALVPEKSTLLERSFTVRFRCLLDNTSGFLRLDIRGRVKILHGQNRKVEEPPLALFAFCTPFGPPSLLEIPQKENMFKSKHKLDFTLVSMDQKGKMTLGYSDSELANMGGYDLVHFDDLAYVASAHQELLKTGASGMIAYRYQKKNGEWQWLQTSSRLVYKNSKPDFIICTHRQLMEEEGRDLLGKRTMDFKVSYLDTGLTSTYFTDADQLIVTPSGSPTAATTSPVSSTQRYNRRYKTQLRDFLSTCRSKRKLQQSPGGQVASPVQMVEYVNDPAVAVAAAYSNLNPMYTTSPYVSTESMYMTPPAHSSNFYSVSDNIFHQYRLQGVGGYFPEYASTPAPYITNNGFVPYEGYGIAKDERWHDADKCMPENDTINREMDNDYESPDIHKKTKQSPSLEDVSSSGKPVQSSVNLTNTLIPNSGQDRQNSSNNVINSNVIKNPNTTKSRETNDMPHSDMKEEALSPQHFEPRRQTVLMWGTSQASKNKYNCSTYNNDHSCSNNTTPTTTSCTTNCSSSQSPASNDRIVVNSNEENNLNLERNETGKVIVEGGYYLITMHD
ncbi:AAEL011825-PB [Aedes aegypti]|uniref:AAEL011825-PB n=1 Tax=Aedes aegypti TaxID=7159 RepID=Q16NX9_AEDAE|nr:AAEL011825-PB [Aedes aegypti]